MSSFVPPIIGKMRAWDNTGALLDVELLPKDRYVCEHVEHANSEYRESAYARIVNYRYPSFFCREHFYLNFKVDPVSKEDYE